MYSILLYAIVSAGTDIQGQIKNGLNDLNVPDDVREPQYHMYMWNNLEDPPLQ